MNYQNEMLQFKKAVVYTLAPIQLPRPFFDSSGGPFQTVPMQYWLELYDQNEVYGCASCSLPLINTLLPLILTGEKKTYGEWYNMLYWKIRNNGFCGETLVELGRLDLALHDILAKRAGLPLHRFWGAARDWTEVYASGLGTGLTDEQLIEEAESFIKSDYKVVKMKIATDFGTRVERDLRRIKMVRDVIGNDIKLALDANQCWNAEQALDFAKRVEDFDIEWFEEPVHSHDFVELKKLTAVCPIPVSAGESMRNHFMFPVYADCGVKHLQPVPSNLGGFDDWCKVRDLAAEKGLVLTSGGFSQITAAYIATASEDAMVEYLIPILKYFAELMEMTPEEKDGRFYLPGEPGLPVRLDMKYLERKELILKKEYYYPKSFAK